jgi:hypothetical protein
MAGQPGLCVLPTATAKSISTKDLTDLQTCFAAPNQQCALFVCVCQLRCHTGACCMHCTGELYASHRFVFLGMLAAPGFRTFSFRTSDDVRPGCRCVLAGLPLLGCTRQSAALVNIVDITHCAVLCRCVLAGLPLLESTGCTNCLNDLLAVQSRLAPCKGLTTKAKCEAVDTPCKGEKKAATRTAAVAPGELSPLRVLRCCNSCVHSACASVLAQFEVDMRFCHAA